MLNEAEVRVLVAEAAHMARTTTPGNMCEAAIVRHVMADDFKGGDGWRSRWFETEDRPDPGMMVIYDGR